MHPIVLRVALGIVAFLTASTTVEAAEVSLKAVKKNGIPISHGTCNFGSQICTTGNVGKSLASNDDCHVPTSSLIVVGGDTIEAEIFLSGWGNELPLGVRTYLVTLDGRVGFTSGDSGSILPLGWCAPVDTIHCMASDQCPAAYPICSASGQCMCAEHNPSLGAFITGLRPDWIFGTWFPTVPCDVSTSTLDYSFFCILIDEVGATDPGAPRYAGSLTLRVSPNACGTFTIGFRTGQEGPTVIGDPSTPSLFVYPSSQPLVLSAGDCCRPLFSCVPEHCNVDARIANDPNTEEGLTDNTIIMAFCESTMGMTPDDFEVTRVPFVPTDPVPTIADATPVEGGSWQIIVVLDQPILEARWTCVRHIESNRQCCIGSLPGDANNDLIVHPDDVSEIVDNLQGMVIPALAIEKCDTDRSLLCTPADLLTVVDLLQCESVNACDSLPDCPLTFPP